MGYPGIPNFHRFLWDLPAKKTIQLMEYAHFWKPWPYSQAMGSASSVCGELLEQMGWKEPNWAYRVLEEVQPGR